MSDVTVREQLIAAMLTALRQAWPAPDDDPTRETVLYGLPSPEDDRDLPVTVLQEGPDDVQENYDVALCTMPVAVVRIEQAAPEAARTTMRQQAHAALRTLTLAMYADETFGNLSAGITCTAAGISVDGRLAIAEAAFSVRYRHVRGAPSQPVT